MCALFHPGSLLLAFCDSCDIIHAVAKLDYHPDGSLKVA